MHMCTHLYIPEIWRNAPEIKLSSRHVSPTESSHYWDTVLPSLDPVPPLLTLS